MQAVVQDAEVQNSYFLLQTSKSGFVSICLYGLFAGDVHLNSWASFIQLFLVIEYPSWTDPLFLMALLLSSFMGFVLNYSIILCTAYNSALTTTVLGVIKNLLVTYLGLFIGGDCVFSITKFVGINFR